MAPLGKHGASFNLGSMTTPPDTDDERWAAHIEHGPPWDWDVHAPGAPCRRCGVSASVGAGRPVDSKAMGMDVDREKFLALVDGSPGIDSPDAEPEPPVGRESNARCPFLHFDGNRCKYPAGHTGLHDRAARLPEELHYAALYRAWDGPDGGIAKVAAHVLRTTLHATPKQREEFARLLSSMYDKDLSI